MGLLNDLLHFASNLSRLVLKMGIMSGFGPKEEGVEREGRVKKVAGGEVVAGDVEAGGE